MKIHDNQSVSNPFKLLYIKLMIYKYVTSNNAHRTIKVKKINYKFKNNNL